MYERFYDLRERPFALSPDPAYLYPSRVHREALDHLRYGLESHAGFIVVTGEIGSGKTTLVQTLLRGLDSHATVGRIVNTMLEPRELLETILIDFGLDPSGLNSKALLLRDLSQYLVDQRLAGRMVLLVIDEAQNLSLASLEELRMLSNLETDTSKLIQILLVGQPELREKLAAPELQQFRQRITVSYHLDPLDADDVARYINHRLRRAALGVPLEMPREVADMVHRRSGGVPRIINVICDAALVFGYADDRRQIDTALMSEVIAELESTGVLPSTGVPHTRAIGASPHVIPAVAAPVIVPAGGQIAAPVGGSAQNGTIDGAKARNAELDRRERVLMQREQELGQQRRILAEEYRLLRMQRPQTTSSAPFRVQLKDQARPAPLRFTPTAPISFWARFKRVMLGTSAPATEN